MKRAVVLAAFVAACPFTLPAQTTRAEPARRGSAAQIDSAGKAFATRMTLAGGFNVDGVSGMTEIVRRAGCALSLRSVRESGYTKVRETHKFDAGDLRSDFRPREDLSTRAMTVVYAVKDDRPRIVRSRVMTVEGAPIESELDVTELLLVFAPGAPSDATKDAILAMGRLIFVCGGEGPR